MTVKLKYDGNGNARFYDSDSNKTVLVAAPFYLSDDFEGNAYSTAVWTSTGVNGGALSIHSTIGGALRITTGDADDDDVDVASEIIFNTARGCCCEARIRLNDVSGTAFNFGFSDAQSEAADKIACTYSSTTVTTNVSDGALFFHDPDAASVLIRAITINNDRDSTVISSTETPSDSTWYILRINCSTDGDVEFYVDGTLIGNQTGGLRSTNDLCLYFGLINRESTANTADIDYIRAWQK